MSCKMAREKPFKRFTQVGHQMKPVGALDRLGNRSLSRSSIVPSAIPAHDPDFWVRFHPGGCGFGFSIGEDIFDLMSLQIDQKRAEGTSTLEWSGKGNDVAIVPSPKNRAG